MSAEPHPAIRARSLANVLADVREARDDWLEACAAVEREEPDADDRESEAETRFHDLRDELATRFVDATGLTVEDFRNAYAGALI